VSLFRIVTFIVFRACCFLSPSWLTVYSAVFARLSQSFACDRQLIAAFIRTHRRALSTATLIQSAPLKIISVGSILISSFCLCWGLRGLFLQAFQSTSYTFISPCAVMSRSFYLAIWWSWWYIVRSTYYGTPNYGVFCSLPDPNIFLIALFF
jgi:hypothetical protein